MFYLGRPVLALEQAVDDVEFTRTLRWLERTDIIIIIKKKIFYTLGRYIPEGFEKKKKN